MSKQGPREIDRLLDQIEQTDTPEEVQIETAIEVDEEGTPTLHIFLVDGEDDENTVEGSLEGEQRDHETDQEQATSEEAQETPQEQPVPQHPMTWQYPLWARVINLLGVVVFFGPVLLIPVGVPVFQLPVTVMIEPVTAQLELEMAITLKSRQLETPPLSQSETVQTTGKGYQQAASARGFITFYNAALFPQTIVAGTLLSGANGVAVVTDRDALVPPGTLATNGQATVGAHALQPGAAGNIRAGEIYGPCCRANVFATNGTFTDGVEVRSYPMVAEQDIEQTANTLKASLQSRVQGIFSTQLQSGEAVTSPQCQPTVISSHKAGEEAKETTITVALSCSASAYSTEQFQKALHFELSLYGTEQLNSCYQQRGEATILTLSSKAEKYMVTLTVKARASYVYQFTETLFDLYKQAIAGKSKRDAVAWLEQQSGIGHVILTGDPHSMLPTTLGGINLVVIQRGGRNGPDDYRMDMEESGGSISSLTLRHQRPADHQL